MLGFFQIARQHIHRLLAARPHNGGCIESPDYHDAKIRELERRRREVKRHYDQLQQSRPDEGALIEQ